MEGAGCSDVTMVGHSKGGAEAVANAIATDRDSIVFNPATTFLSSYELSSKGYTGDMTVFVVKGEILHTAEGWFSKPIDKFEYLPTQHKIYLWDNRVVRIYKGIRNHLMDAVIDSLIEEGDKYK